MEWPVEFAPVEPEPLFYNQAGRVSDDATDLAGPDLVPEDAAIFSVLQFGGIAPPLSPWRGVGRFMPGYRYEDLQSSQPIPLAPPPGIATLDLEERANIVEHTLDEVLARMVGDGPHPVLLFSGGVDSGLIACRLAALGYSDTVLLNYSYGPDDPESVLAEEMAAQLGLPFERIYADLVDQCACLHEPGRIWPQPFSDPGTVDVWDLVPSLVDRSAGTGRPILDGTGSLMDKMVTDWQRLLRTPRAARQAISSLYGIHLWKRSEKVDRAMRTARRSVTMPPLPATLGDNALAGILYDDTYTRHVAGALTEWLEGWAGTTFPRQMAAGGFAFKCGAGFGARAPALLAPAGIAIHYPLLATEWVAMALEAAQMWKTKEGKAPEKCALARHVPAHMVYRPKSGFLDPKARIFFDPTFIEYLRAAVEPDGPIAHMLKPKRVTELCNVLERGHRPSQSILRCAWGIVFLDRWYRTAQ